MNRPGFVGGAPHPRHWSVRRCSPRAESGYVAWTGSPQQNRRLFGGQRARKWRPWLAGRDSSVRSSVARCVTGPSCTDGNKTGADGTLTSSPLKKLTTEREGRRSAVKLRLGDEMVSRLQCRLRTPACLRGKAVALARRGRAFVVLRVEVGRTGTRGTRGCRRRPRREDQGDPQ